MVVMTIGSMLSSTVLMTLGSMLMTIGSMFSSIVLKSASVYAHNLPGRGTAPGLAMRV